MKTKKILILLMLLAYTNSYTQGLSNFFSQKEADIKYMLAQIAELQTYIDYIEKGYDIARKGLTFIGDLKNGEFNLYNSFFSALKTVNPAIASYSKVADIINFQVSIVSSFKKILQLGNFSTAEISYLKTVYNNMTNGCAESLTELINIITADMYEMKDNERMQRIDALYSDMKDRYSFAQSFYSDASLLSAQRQNENLENEFLKKLY